MTVGIQELSPMQLTIELENIAAETYLCDAVDGAWRSNTQDQA